MRQNRVSRLHYRLNQAEESLAESMGRRWLVSSSTFTLFVLLAACNLVPGVPAEETAALLPGALAEETAALVETPVVALPASETPPPTLAPTVTATATATPSPSATATVAPPVMIVPDSEEGDLSLHPDDVLI